MQQERAGWKHPREWVLPLPGEAWVEREARVVAREWMPVDRWEEKRGVGKEAWGWGMRA